jgi:predicted RNase H-like nuclease
MKQNKKIMKQEIFKAGCWSCLRAQQDPNEEYVCPQIQQHWAAYEQQEQSKYF